ncbi:unnamed protein product [Sphagnum jensenii]|uniref:Pectate lyase n=1 Tax=Sphagnum jensenii TaxID=128206 RepID=A0ABP1BA92_9BRYO
MPTSSMWPIRLFKLVPSIIFKSCNSEEVLEKIEFPEEFVKVDERKGNYTRRVLAGCGTGNPIDDCWRCDPNWESNRQSLADCAIGFGQNAIGGRNGEIYVVTDDSDDAVTNPKYGTLRWGVIQTQPLWIIFARDMMITLKEELIMNSFKTLDGRGANVHIAGGACLTLQYISNVIVHGLHIHDCKSTGDTMVISTPTHVGYRGMADGDAVSIAGSHDLWVDHNFLANAADGLVDAIEGSTDITVSNNYFTNHDKVMLLGAHPKDTIDVNMRVTVAFNHFGPNLVQRMPRCRFGSFHVVNNFYSQWEMYAVGGSENPTINSEGNYYAAPNNAFFKEVTKRIADGGTKNVKGWKDWNWRSVGDIFDNGAYFVDSGAAANDAGLYAKATSFTARPANMVAVMTNDAGPLML